jgi:hypothetical protein
MSAPTWPGHAETRPPSQPGRPPVRAVVAGLFGRRKSGEPALGPGPSPELDKAFLALVREPLAPAAPVAPQAPPHSAPAEPPVADPVIPESGVAEPVVAEPVAEPVVSEPVVPEPAVAREVVPETVVPEAGQEAVVRAKPAPEGSTQAVVQVFAEFAGSWLSAREVIDAAVALGWVAGGPDPVVLIGAAISKLESGNVLERQLRDDQTAEFRLVAGRHRRPAERAAADADTGDAGSRTS